MNRVEILEDRIRYAIDLIGGGFVAEAVAELDRALHEPDWQQHASGCATHNAPAYPAGECDCK